MSGLTGFCPSCGESVVVDVVLIGMSLESERITIGPKGKFRSWLAPRVAASDVAHACRIEAAS